MSVINQKLFIITLLFSIAILPVADLDARGGGRGGGGGARGGRTVGHATAKNINRTNTNLNRSRNINDNRARTTNMNNARNTNINSTRNTNYNRATVNRNIPLDNANRFTVTPNADFQVRENSNFTVNGAKRVVARRNLNNALYNDYGYWGGGYYGDPDNYYYDPNNPEYNLETDTDDQQDNDPNDYDAENPADYPEEMQPN